MFFIFDASATKEKEPKIRGLLSSDKFEPKTPSASQAKVAAAGAKVQKTVAPAKQGVKIEIRDQGGKTQDGMQTGTMHVTFEKGVHPEAIAEALKDHDLADTNYHAILPMEGAEVTITSTSSNILISTPVLLEKKGGQKLSGVRNIHPEVASSVHSAYANMVEESKPGKSTSAEPEQLPLNYSEFNKPLKETLLANKTEMEKLEFLIPTTLEGVRDRTVISGNDASLKKPEDIVAANKIMQKTVMRTGKVHELVSTFENLTQNDLNAWMDKNNVIATAGVVLYNMAADWVAKAEGVPKESIIAQDFKDMPGFQQALIKTLGHASEIRAPKHKFAQSWSSKQLIASLQEKRTQETISTGLTAFFVWEGLVNVVENSSTLAQKAAKDEKFAQKARDEQITASQETQEKIVKGLIKLEKPFADYNLALIEILEKKLPPGGSVGKAGGEQL